MAKRSCQERAPFGSIGRPARTRNISRVFGRVAGSCLTAAPAAGLSLDPGPMDLDGTCRDLHGIE
jgi:hypothetical protein